MVAFYFGCWGDVGHYLHDVRGRHLYRADHPWAGAIDGTLAPRRDRVELPQGVAALHHKDGWTALAMWDRSVDRRRLSSSTFLFDVVLDFDAAVAAASEHFPSVVGRPGFPEIVAAP